MRFRAIAAFLALSLLGACSDKSVSSGGLRIRVDADEALRSRIDEVRVESARGARTFRIGADQDVRFPLTFDAAGEVVADERLLRIRAFERGREIVRRTARISLDDRKAHLWGVYLSTACEGAFSTCDEGADPGTKTCIDCTGECATSRVKTSALPVIQSDQDAGSVWQPPACANGGDMNGDASMDSSTPSAEGGMDGALPTYSDEGGTDDGGTMAGDATGSAPDAGGVPLPHQSCNGLAATCGGADDCCASINVPGTKGDEKFQRGNDPLYPATLNGFILDKYEVTVGRYAKFAYAYNIEGWRPAPNAGANPDVPGSGWQREWDTELPVDAVQGLDCFGHYQTWTRSDNANYPINCLTWYLSFAFCAWEGGRLPTELEWSYAAAGGSDQLTYPWGPEDPDSARASFAFLDDGTPGQQNSQSEVSRVGTHPTGAGRWGHLDMAGSMSEWVFDSNGTYTADCHDCARSSGPSRMTRGGDFGADATAISTTARAPNPAELRMSGFGVRCAYDAPREAPPVNPEIMAVVPSAPSCDGLDDACGASNEDCCTTLTVPGTTSSFNRSNNALYPGTVDAFYLDKYEVSVGRYEKFIEAYSKGFRPELSDGANPDIQGSGWQSAWDAKLPSDATSGLDCYTNYQTFSRTGSELYPINCVPWYMAFAFCAWDNARLPTELEWNYAAAGGSAQRAYPWGADSPDGSRAVYDFRADGSAAGESSSADVVVVGTRPLGAARWGHLDLAGSLDEWVFDSFATYAASCADCGPNEAGKDRVLRGGDFSDLAASVMTSARSSHDPATSDSGIGFRCARDVP